MDNKKNINVGIGFITGRKRFQHILKTHVYSWHESGIVDEVFTRLYLFVAYDLKYSKTKTTDYTNVHNSILNLVDGADFIGKKEIQTEIDYLAENNVITKDEGKLLFIDGYAGKRNAVLYCAIKHKMDYLLFLDDDEYPIAVTKTGSTALWSGQQILLSHLQNIESADITNGHHCGYISPIPYLEFNEILSEADFRLFIEAISNDIISWDKIRSVMKNGGVTYADTSILINETVEDVEEVNHTKFISGANLCINLTKPERVYPFYNPPGARGEDTFLSTCLSDRKVLRTPCYAFHDGFSTYIHLLDGVLPIKLKNITSDSDKIIERFYKACIGWIRYKPLLLYITQPDSYEEKISDIRERLNAVLPKICEYFGTQDFMNVAKELESYNKSVKRHFDQFIKTKQIWARITEFLQDRANNDRY